MSEVVISKSDIEMPYGWEYVALEKICTVDNGRCFKKTEWVNEGYPIIRIQNLKNEAADFNYFSGDLGDQHKVVSGDLLFAWSGTPGTSFGAHIWYGKNAALNQHIFNVRFDKKIIDTKYFYYALNQEVARFVALAQGGVGLAHITKGKFMAAEIPLMPLEQQKRIVAKIEELFSHIDAGIAGLNKTKQLLKQYRQSVLKAAVTGELTKQWREENKDKLEPASQLLERILNERRQKWESQQMEQFKAKGKVPKDDGWKGKYLELDSIDDAALEKLPLEWCWVKNEQIGEIQLGRQRAPKYHNGPNMRPYLRVQNIFEDKIDLDDVMEMEFSDADFEKYSLKYNDILLNEGQSPELLGRPAIYRDEMPGVCFTNTLIRFKAASGLIPEFALLVYRYCMHSGRFTKAGTITTNIGHLSAGRFSQIEFPLCSTREQKEIVRITDEKFIAINRLSTDIHLQLIKAEKNKQSILAAAFSGKL